MSENLVRGVNWWAEDAAKLGKLYRFFRFCRS